MSVIWSPRKRIKLSSEESRKVVPKPTEDRVSRGSVEESSGRENKSKKKRVSADFVKELDECLEPGALAFNPTQVFLVDADMELAMLNIDAVAPPVKSSQGGTVPPSMPTPLADTTNLMRKSSVEKLDPTPAGASQSTSPSPPTATQLVDELDGIDIDQLTAIADDAELMYTQGSRVNPGMFSARCRVTNIPIYTSTGDLGIEVVEDPPIPSSQEVKKFVILQGVWRASYEEDPWQVVVGDFVHILCASKTWISNTITVSDSSTLFPDIIVFHPDSVISSTTLSASATCHRRSVIQNRVLAPSVGPPPEAEDDINRALSPIIGNCVHEAIQAAAEAGNFSQSFVLEAGEKSLAEQMLSSVWMCGGLPNTVVLQLRNRLHAISQWGTMAWPRVASRLRGCEVEIRPASLGVTGKLDMDIEDIHGARSCIEIKTGKHHAIHVGQVVLYYLLQYVDKFGNPDNEFAQKLPQHIATEYLLLYLQSTHKEADMISVKISPRECQNIMRNRNLIASHTVKRTLPDPIYKRGDCEFCPVRRECTVAASAAGVSDENWSRLSNSVQLSYRTNRESLSESEKAQIFGYLHAWLEWIDIQPTNAHGGLSAVRRMRGNILNMISHHLFRETGAHAGEELAFFDWVPLLALGKNPDPSVSGVKATMNWLLKYNPKRNVGRAVTLAPNTDDLVGSLSEIIKGLISKKERVLLCGSSHDAIDTVLEKIVENLDESYHGRITRIASRPEDVRERLRGFVIPDNWDKDPDNFEKSRVLIACTVKAVHHDLLSRGDFNCAIVVGANKTPDPFLWGVMVRSRQVVLVETIPKEEVIVLEEDKEEEKPEKSNVADPPPLPVELLFKRIPSIRV